MVTRSVTEPGPAKPGNASPIRPVLLPRFKGVPTVHMFPLAAGGARSDDHRKHLRYAFRLYPDTAQRIALARAFGCARVVFNDAVRAREDARRAGAAFPTAGELSRKLITEAKRTVERSWLGEVSAVVLQQALRDAEACLQELLRLPQGGP